GNCPDLFTDVGGTCYYFSSDFQLMATWYDALAACKELGDGLGRINVGLAEVGTSSDGCTPDIELMQTISTTGHNHWLGASDGHQEDTWIWQESKEQLLDMNTMWHDTEPGGGTDQNCLIAGTWSSDHNRARLNDYPCTATGSYVCQIF
ncbi:unnamed protein product, partial [Meganyctiphanes norvegica]